MGIFYEELMYLKTMAQIKWYYLKKPYSDLK